MSLIETLYPTRTFAPVGRVVSPLGIHERAPAFQVELNQKGAHLNTPKMLDARLEERARRRQQLIDAIRGRWYHINEIVEKTGIKFETARSDLRALVGQCLVEAKMRGPNPPAYKRPFLEYRA